MDNHDSLSKLLRVTSSTALCSGAAVLMGWMLTSNIKPDYLASWKTAGLAGCVGSLLGAQWSISGRPWFSRH